MAVRGAMMRTPNVEVPVATDARWMLGGLGFLYFVADDRAAAVKIGWSEHPHRRFVTLQVSSAVELRLIGYIPVDGDGLTEGALHDLLDGRRIRGEWYEIDAPEPYLEVAAEYAAWHGSRRTAR